MNHLDMQNLNRETMKYLKKHNGWNVIVRGKKHL